MSSQEQLTHSLLGTRARARFGSIDGRLAQPHSTLTELLSVVEDDARQLDANLHEAHELVQDIRVHVKRRVVRPDGSLDGGLRHQYQAFDKSQRAESDAYEVYAADLELFRKRQRMSLGVAEADSDRKTLVRCRRAYISMLIRCRNRALLILEAG